MQIMQSVLHRLCVVGTCCVCCTCAVCADMHRAAGWQHSAACRALSVCVIITSGPYMLVRQAVMCRHVAQHLEMRYNAWDTLLGLHVRMSVVSYVFSTDMSPPNARALNL